MWRTCRSTAVVAGICVISLCMSMVAYKKILLHLTTNRKVHVRINNPNLTNVSLITKATSITDDVDCNPGIPCEYPEIVDFRIIILTFSRHLSLLKLLKSLDKLEGVHHDKAIIEIWIDRDKEQNVNQGVLQIAQAFNWTKGIVRTHVQKQHVGIIGQWIHTWRPPANGKEIGVIIEDDISVSPHIYRWLKAAHSTYGGRTNIGGYNLHCGKQILARGSGWVTGPPGSPYLYKLLGTWGYSPHPNMWRDFQDWFTVIRRNSSFHPYVNGLLMTEWYKGFEARNYEHSMWEQWWIYYCDKFNLYSLYSNIQSMVNTATDKGQCLIVNRKEAGLHQVGTGDSDIGLLLSVWKDKFIKFPNTTVRLDWDGNPPKK